MIGREQSLRVARVEGSARNRRGFTLIELMVVVTIVGLLAALAQPSLQRMLLKAQAAAAIGELNVLKTALQQYEAEFQSYPAESGEGTIPTGLAPFLPDGYSFTQKGYVIDYDNFTGSGTWDIGMTVIPEDPALGQAMVDVSGNSVFALGGRYTWILLD